jgi:tetratricopeptide (TPR) repeat protein
MPKAIKKRPAKQHPSQDELKSSYEHLKHYIEKNRKRSQLILGVSIGFIAIAALIVTYRVYSHTQVSTLNYRAYNAFYGQSSKADSEKRLKASLADFQRSYNAEKSPISLLYAAAAFIELGNIDEGEKTLIQFNNTYQSYDDLLPVSYYKLFELYKGKGAHEKALETIKKLYSLKSPIFKDLALFEWASVLNAQGKADEAKAKIAELEKNFPQSPFIMKKAEEAGSDNPAK